VSRKSDYERLIDESILFSLDREREQSAYRRESLKMVDYLYRYLMEINQKKYEAYGLEIVETANYCIKNFDASSGRFLNYFITSWTTNYSHIVSKEWFDSEHSAMKFTENQRREYMRYKKICSKLGIDKESPDFEQRVAESLGIPISDIRDLILLDDIKIESIDGSSEMDDGSRVKQYDSGVNVENDFIRADENIRFLNYLETVFMGIQERQKDMISILITSSLSLAIDNEIVLEVFKCKAYFNNDIYKECLQKKERLSNKDIASRLGIKEASLSRSWTSFKEKIDTNTFL